MGLATINPTKTTAWKKLEQHIEAIKDQEMKTWFSQNPDRAAQFSIQWKNFYVDYSKNRFTEETLKLLLQLAQEVKLEEAIHKLFSGEAINKTENRAVLHTDLRKRHQPEEVCQALSKMEKLSSDLRSGMWRGFSGKKITDIVNIGIGGSDLGPHMAVEALRHYHDHTLNVHFISNVDGDQSAEILKKIAPETTLVIIVSKSFRTIETMTNAEILREWLLKATSKENLKKHFVAVTSNTDAAQQMGISKENIFPMWDWVGGRFSIWSTAGLSLCLYIGFSNFKKFLEGARHMDEHFASTNFSENIPVLLALLSVWYNNFYHTESEAILPYSHYLSLLVPYLQQAVMESNGKSTSRAGERISYQTGNIIWGATGTNAQHAFFQLLHQGTKLIPCDFIGFKKPLHHNTQSHDLLMANFMAQTEALLKGKTKTEVWQEMDIQPDHQAFPLWAFKEFKGNKPSTTILIDQLTPESLGSLLALYEHKIFVEGVIWNIFSFDQWGVEYGKQLAATLFSRFTPDTPAKEMDSSTFNLVRHYKEK